MAAASTSQFYAPQKPPAHHTTSLKYEKNWTETLPGDSIYIFPNPPSSLGSPTQHSELSLLTDCEFSELSESKSPVDNENDGHPFNWLPLTPLTPFESGTRRVEWMQSDANDILLGIRDRADQWREVIARKRARESYPEFLRSGSRQRPLSVGKDDRQVGSRLPFLSFFTSLLSVDEATFQLLSHASSYPTLFPGQIRLSDPGPNDDEWDNESHGVQKLLGPSESRVAIEGYAAASDAFNPYGPFSAISFVELWNFVTDLMINGGKRIQKSLQRPTS